MSQDVIAQKDNLIKNLSAQLEAAKQLVNEGLASSLQLRTNFQLFQQAYVEMQSENAKLIKQLEEAKAQIPSAVVEDAVA